MAHKCTPPFLSGSLRAHLRAIFQTGVVVMDLCISGVIILREIELLSTWKTSQRLSGCLCFLLLGLWGPCREGQGCTNSCCPTRTRWHHPFRCVETKSTKMLQLCRCSCVWALGVSTNGQSFNWCVLWWSHHRKKVQAWFFLFISFAFHYFKIKILEGSVVIYKYVHPFHPKETFPRIWSPGKVAF